MARVEWIIEHSEDQESVWLAKMVRDARRELAEAKAEIVAMNNVVRAGSRKITRLTTERDALREAALSVASEVRGDHHLASSAYELMEDAIAALAQSAVSGKWSERDRDPRWHTIFDKEDTQ